MISFCNPQKSASVGLACEDKYLRRQILFNDSTFFLLRPGGPISRSPPPPHGQIVPLKFKPMNTLLHLCHRLSCLHPHHIFRTFCALHLIFKEIFCHSRCYY